MTALEHLNARLAPIHPSRRRAPARTAKVRSNSDTSPQDSPSEDAEQACISLRRRRRNRHSPPR
jgi:hypothetical protein